MKKSLVFILGMISGVAFSVLVLTLLVFVQNSSVPHDFNMFEQPGECLVSKSSLKVFQVLSEDSALTTIKGDYSSAVYLLVNDDGKSYYDDQIIKLPAKKCFRQIGTYRYQTKDDRWKTVPAVQIM
jgi:hypothetical protein